MIAGIQSQQKSWLQKWMEEDPTWEALVDVSKFDNNIPADAFDNIETGFKESFEEFCNRLEYPLLEELKNRLTK